MTFIADYMWLWLLVSLCSLGFILYLQADVFRKHSPRVETDLDRGLTFKKASDAFRERIISEDVGNDRASKTAMLVSITTFALFLVAGLIRLST